LLFDPRPGRQDRYYDLRGGFVHGFDFDPNGFDIDAQQLEGLDDTLVWSLHVAREGLRDAGYLQRGQLLERCGVILGNLSFPTRRSYAIFSDVYRTVMSAAHTAQADFQLHGNPANTRLDGYPAELVRAALGLGGPSMCLDAACATSLYTIRIACDVLNARRADLMLAGAVSAADPVFLQLGFSVFQALPGMDHASAALNQESGGLLASNGAGMFVLKRLPDALRDDDRIYAVIRGVGLSNDGRGRHLLVPNPRGQQLAFERAYADAGTDPAGVTFVECHATGTQVGDATEVHSIEAFFGQHGADPVLGAVKANVGHLLTAAGMAGVLKTVLAMRHGVIPGTPGLDHPRTARALSQSQSWPGPRRAGVNAFGFGGTNAHLVLEDDTFLEDALSSVSPREVERANVIVGMAARFGCISDLNAFSRAVLQPLGERVDALQGAYIDHFDLDCRRFRLPPTTEDQAIPQQLLVLEVADAALRDAGVTEGSRVGVIVAMGTEMSLHRVRARAELALEFPPSLTDQLEPAPGVNRYLSYIGNIMASRLSALWDFTGPAFTVSAGVESVSRALEVAELILHNDGLDAVVVAAVDLAGSLERVALRGSGTGSPVGEGCGAIVLMPRDATRHGEVEVWADLDPAVRTRAARDVERDVLRAVGDAGVATPMASLIATVLRENRTRRPRVLVDGPGPRQPVDRGGPDLFASRAAKHATGAGAAAVAHAASLSRARRRLAETHARFLAARQSGMRHLATMLRQPADDLTPAGDVWNEADLLEFAQGSIGKVFGHRFAEIDGFRRRVRLPTPPYLLVSRVIHLQAELGRFEPSTITTEYDVPESAWYLVDGQVPWCVAIESGQCDLLLIAYMGIDLQNRGERVYRLLDCSLRFVGPLPRAGSRLRYEIRIERFARSGDTLLFFFAYDAYVDGRLLLKMEGGCAGFFSDDELAHGRGIIGTQHDALRPAPGRGSQLPDLSLPAVPPMLRMLDRILTITVDGEPSDTGEAVAEKILEPDAWYFRCHFKDDPVLAGSLVMEGCVQLLQVYMQHVGLRADGRRGDVEPIVGLQQSVRCRGEVTPSARRLIYHLRVREVGRDPRPFAVGDVDVLLDEKVIVQVHNLGLRVEDDRRPVFGEREITAFATGSITACFGPEFALYEGRRIPRTPNGRLQLISRVISVDGRRGELTSGRVVSEFDVPAQPWFHTELTDDPAPYAILMELGLQPCGFLSAYLGSTMSFPGTDFRFRNLDGSGCLRGPVDIRGKTVQNDVRLHATAQLDGAILQRFAYSLSVDGQPFFAGEAEFGYFTDAVLSEQPGLDAGRDVAPWYVTSAVQMEPRRLGSESTRPAVQLLEEVLVVPGGGSASLAYVYAAAHIDPSSWYFAAHFYQDPVMPGSLGVEAIMQALWHVALEMDLVREFGAPRYGPLPDHSTVWKYRGQILPTDRLMQLEVHVSRITRDPARVVLVGDAWVWNGDRRIYAVHDAAIAITDSVTR
jgi:3-oxoacyl-(acyl-carrier-protein) synthase/3-hydroxymyristoyl/3-hydroxydecanoyl-(acyl carrier protein) dehydratase